MNGASIGTEETLVKERHFILSSQYSAFEGQERLLQAAEIKAGETLTKCESGKLAVRRKATDPLLGTSPSQGDLIAYEGRKD